MIDQVKIEKKPCGFVIVLIQSGSSHEMDSRPSYADAEHFACYLARKVKLPVYYGDHKIK